MGKRMMHWTCRRCEAKWTEPMPHIPTKKGSPRRFVEDGHEWTICDGCLDKMTLKPRESASGRSAELAPKPQIFTNQISGGAAKSL